MEFLAGLLVAKPFNILIVALVVFALAWIVRKKSSVHGRSARPLWIAGAAWTLYAAWECLVGVKTPDADMRVDLLLIWPFVGVLTLWAAYRAFRRQPSTEEEKSP